MNKAEMYSVISEKTGVSKTTVELIVSTMHETIVDTLKKGDEVKISGFGSFCTRKRLSRRGRNPKTGEIVDIPQKSIAKFRAGTDLKNI